LKFLENIQARMALKSLALFKRKVLISHVVLTAALLAAAYFLIDAAQIEHSLSVTIATELAIVVLVFATPRLLANRVLRTRLSRLNTLFDQTPAPGLSVMLRLVGFEVDRVEDHLRRLRNTALGIPISEASEWTRTACFEVTSGQYIAADSNPPDRFLARYSAYLDAHEEYIQRTGRSDSHRMLIVGNSELEQDRTDHPTSFANFLDWHRRHAVTLSRVDPAEARRLAADAGLMTTDLGFWGDELVLLWTTSDDGARVHVRLAFKGEPLFAECQRYLELLAQRATPLESD
jgi:hypothetical protein